MRRNTTQIRLGTFPYRGPLGSRRMWRRAFPDIASQVLACDTQGLLDVVCEPAEPVGPNGYSRHAAAALGLGLVGADGAIPYLAELIAPSNPRLTRKCALLSLRRIGGRDAGVAAEVALHDKEKAIRWSAATLIGAECVERCAPTLAAVARDDVSKMVRADAAAALGRMHDRAWIGTLERIAQKDAFLPALGAIRGLRDLTSETSFRELADLAGRVGWVRRLWIWRHIRIGRCRVRDKKLPARPKDPTPRPRPSQRKIKTNSVNEPLRLPVGQEMTAWPRLTPKQRRKHVKFLQHRNRRFTYMRRVGDFGPLDPRDAPEILALLAVERDPEIHYQLFRVLVDIQTPAAIPQMLTETRSKDWRCRLDALGGLNKLELTKDAAPTLIASLQDKSKMCVRAAARALVKIGDISALPALENAANRARSPYHKHRLARAIKHLNRQQLLEPDLHIVTDRET
jgi:HEAT repeat protein